MKASLSRGVAIVGVGNLIGTALGVVFSIVAARLLNTSAYGEIRYELSIATLLNTLIISGYGTSVIRHLGKESDNRLKQSSYFTNGLVLTIVTTPVLMLAGFLIGGMRWSVAAVVVGGSLTSVYSALQMGLIAPARLSMFVVVTGSLRIAGLLPFIFYGSYANSSLILLVYSIIPALGIIGLEAILRSPIDIKRNYVDRAVIRDIAAFSVPIIMGNAAFVALSGTDLILLEFFQGTQDVGIYSATKTLPALFLFIPQAFSTILLPWTAKEKTTSPVIQGYISPLRTTLLISIPFLLGLFFLGKEVMYLLFPGRYFASESVLVLLGVAMMFAGIHWILGAVWVGQGRPYVTAIGSAVGACVYLSSGVFLIPAFDLVGASVSLILGYGTACLVLFIYILMDNGMRKGLRGFLHVDASWLMRRLHIRPNQDD